MRPLTRAEYSALIYKIDNGSGPPGPSGSAGATGPTGPQGSTGPGGGIGISVRDHGAIGNGVTDDTVAVQAGHAAAAAAGSALFFPSGTYLAVRAPRSMNHVCISNLNTAGSAVQGVAVELGTGVNFDTAPIFTSINNGTDPAWAQFDGNDNAITGSVFPIIGGNEGATGYNSRIREGMMPPTNFLTGNLGDMYFYRPTTTTASVYFKSSQSVAGAADSSGWILLK